MTNFINHSLVNAYMKKLLWNSNADFSFEWHNHRDVGSYY